MLLRRIAVFVAIGLGGLAVVGAGQEAKKGPGFGPGGPPPFFGPPGPSLVSNLMLVGIPEVQQELQCSEDQKAQIKELVTEFQQQMRASFSAKGFEEIREMTPEERNKWFAEARAKGEQATKQADEKLDRILDPAQLERLEELRLQREGVAAFNRPEVAKRLGLSEEQQSKIKQIQQEAMKAARAPFPGPDATDEDRREFFTRMQKQREKVQADLLNVLTDEQKEKWEAMKGKEFKFPQPRFGPGGPGGFGPGAPRRQPPPEKQ